MYSPFIRHNKRAVGHTNKIKHTTSCVQTLPLVLDLVIYRIYEDVWIMIKIQGLQRISLLDYPEHIACTVFTPNCNFRCPFCHNASLVLPEKISEDFISEEYFFEFLSSRKNKLEAVCISGGEPLLQKDIEYFMEKIKKMGFLVKLDTNGSFPTLLKRLVNLGLIDYVAMDLKNSPAKYAPTAGVSSLDNEKIEESVSFLLSHVVPYEFRTTIVEEFHAASDIEAIAKWIQGDSKYYLQQFVDSGDLIQKGLQAPNAEKRNEFQKIAQRYVPKTKWRGAENI